MSTAPNRDYPLLEKRDFLQSYKEALKDVACAPVAKAVYVRLEDDMDSDDENPVAGSLFAESDSLGEGGVSYRLFMGYDAALRRVLDCIESDGGDALLPDYEKYRERNLPAD